MFETADCMRFDNLEDGTQVATVLVEGCETFFKRDKAGEYHAMAECPDDGGEKFAEEYAFAYGTTLRIYHSISVIVDYNGRDTFTTYDGTSGIFAKMAASDMANLFGDLTKGLTDWAESAGAAGALARAVRATFPPILKAHEANKKSASKKRLREIEDLTPQRAEAYKKLRRGLDEAFIAFKSAPDGEARRSAVAPISDYANSMLSHRVLDDLLLKESRALKKAVL